MKKIALAVIIFILIVLGIFLVMRNYEPRKKTLAPGEEYPAFINANIEFTCEIIKNPLLEGSEEAENLVNEIYKKYKLPVNDDETMITILNKYENDEEVISIIQLNTTNCQKGGSPILYQP